jgi:hypothetical protein
MHIIHTVLSFRAIMSTTPLTSSSISSSKFKTLLASPLLKSKSSDPNMLQNLDLAEFPSSKGRVDGLISKAAYSVKDTIIQLPLNAALYGTASNQASTNAYSQVYATAVELLREWKKKTSSSFAAYIDLLPSHGTVGTLIHWTAAEIEQLGYEPLQMY